MIVYYLNLKEYDEDALYATFLLSARAARIEKANGFLHKIDQVRCLAGEYLLFFALRDHQIETVPHIQKNSYGKPRIDNIKDMHFSISHSGDYVICAVAANNIGADIEKMDLNINLGLAKRFFTPDEFIYILNATDSIEAFYQTWVLKESYVKYIGKGLSAKLDSFSIDFSSNPSIVGCKDLFCNFYELNGHMIGSVSLSNTFELKKVCVEF